MPINTLDAQLDTLIVLPPRFYASAVLLCEALTQNASKGDLFSLDMTALMLGFQKNLSQFERSLAALNPDDADGEKMLLLFLGAQKHLIDALNYGLALLTYCRGLVDPLSFLDGKRAFIIGLAESSAPAAPERRDLELPARRVVPDLDPSVERPGRV